MKNINKLILLFLTVCFLGSCADEDNELVMQNNKNTTLIKVLKELGFEIKDNSIVKNNKFINTKYLNLSGKNLESVEGLEVLENLEVLNLENNMIKKINLKSFPKLKDLNLAKNPNLKDIEGLNGYKESDLEKLILPYHLRHEFGALPLFVKERAKLNPTFSAKIEKTIYGDELRDYNYYYIFKNINVANFIFRFLGEDNFIIVDKHGKKTEALDMSEKIKAIPGKEYNLLIKADRVTTYEDVEILINKGLKFSDFPLKSFEITTEVATRIESLDILDFSGYKDLESVRIDQMPIKEVYFENCSKLKSVEIGNSNLVDSAVPKKPALITVSLKDSPLLESLNLNSMPTLKTVVVNEKAPIKELHLDNISATEVENLNASYIENIYLRNLEVSVMNLKSEMLKNVYVVNTKIPSLDFSKAKKLDGEIIIGENRSLTSLTFPTTKNQECKKIQVYRNKIKQLDLRMYKKINVLAGVVWTGRIYRKKDGEKGAEEGLQELLINVDDLIANLPPSSGKDWDNSNKPSMVIYLDGDFLRASADMKRIYKEGGTDKTKPYIKLYKYGYKYGEYGNVGAIKKITDFN